MLRRHFRYMLNRADKLTDKTTDAISMKYTHTHTHIPTHTRLTALFRDYPDQPVSER